MNYISYIIDQIKSINGENKEYRLVIRLKKKYDNKKISLVSFIIKLNEILNEMEKKYIYIPKIKFMIEKIDVIAYTPRQKRYIRMILNNYKKNNISYNDAIELLNKKYEKINKLKNKLRKVYNRKEKINSIKIEENNDILKESILVNIIKNDEIKLIEEIQIYNIEEKENNFLKYANIIENKIEEIKNNLDEIIIDEDEKIYELMKKIMYLIKYKKKKNILFSFKPIDEYNNKQLFYTIPVVWLLTNNKWIKIDVYNKLKKFFEDPSSFKKYIMKDVDSDMQNYIKEYNDMVILGNAPSNNKGSDCADYYEPYESAHIYEPAFNENNIIEFDLVKDDIDIEDQDINLFEIQGKKYKKNENKILVNLFDQINEEKINNKCFYNSLRYYGINDNKTKQMTSLSIIEKYLDENKINYKIYDSCMEIKKLVLFSDGKLIDIEDKTLVKIIPKYEIISQNLKNNNSEKYLVFAISHNINNNIGHIFVPKTKIFFISPCMQNLYYLDEKNKLKLYGKINNKEKLLGKRLIFYDIETNQDYLDKMIFKAVSLSVSYLDVNNEYLQENEIIEKIKTKFYIDENINLYEIISSYFDKSRKNIIIGFNSAKFDNFYLLKSMKKNNIYCNTQINNGMIEISNGPMSEFVYNTWDLKRFIGLGSLEEISDKYIKNEKYRKKKINLFYKLNEYVNDKSIFNSNDEKIIDFKKQLETYNNLDVESLSLITFAFINNLYRINKDENTFAKIFNCISLPQFAYKQFLSSIKNFDEKPQKFKKCKNKKNLEKNYQIFSAYKVGGRCECNKTIMNIDDKIEDVKSINNIKDIIRSPDVCSLYPTVMCLYNKSFFMNGNQIYTEKYIENKTGIYYGAILQNNNYKDEMNFYCEKTKFGNNWNTIDKIIKDVILSSHEIDYIKKNKPNWKIQIHFGYYTENKIKGCELFHSIIPFLKEKSNQDLYKLNKDILYNDSLRETSKTYMNSLSGKFLQSNKDYNYILSYALNIIKIEKDKKDYMRECLKKDKMLHIGLFIYSLSKLYMYEYGYGYMKKSDFIYTDTDSIKMCTNSQFDEWKKINGEKLMKDIIFEECFDMGLGFNENTKLYYDGKGLKCPGQFEDEYRKKNYNHGIFCDKKEYINYNDEGEYKIMCKGVNQQKFLILDEHDDIFNKIIKINFKNKEEKISCEKFFNLDIEERKDYKINIDSKIYNNELYKIIEDRILEDNKKSCLNKMKKIMLNKLKKKSTIILSMNFKRDIYSNNIRNEFILKAI